MAPSNTVGVGVDVKDPQIRALVDSVAGTVALAAQKVVANAVNPAKFPLPSDSGSYEQILRAHFARRPAAAQALTKTRFRPQVVAAGIPATALAGIDLTRPTPMEQQVAALNGHLSLDMARLSLLTPAPAAAAATVNRELRLRINRVVCVDETNGFLGSEAGDDEISLGGTSIDETGDTKTVSRFHVGDFDDGDVVTYSPPRRMTFFNVLEGGSTYPKRYYVTLALAEVDMGGLADFLEKMTAKVKDAIKKKLVEAGSTKGPIGIIVAAVLAEVVGRIFDLIGKAWHDDIFVPQTVRTTLMSPTSRYGTSLTSPVRSVSFKGHGGEYRVDYSWELAR